MLRGWSDYISAWFKRKGAPAAARRRASGRRRLDLVPHLESLESRQLLTSLVAVHVNNNLIDVSELRGGSTSTEADFSLSYTSSQVVLTGTNGTEFRQAGQTMATDTINITAPATIVMQLNQHANDVSISGDGTDNLSALHLRLSAGTQDSSVTLDNVITDSLTLRGRRTDDSVTLDQSTVNDNLTANLGTAAGDSLDLESSTVSGNLNDVVGQLTMNGSTVTGKLHNTEPSQDSTLSTTDTTYNGAVAIHMGPASVINLDSSTTGSNEFHGAVTVVGSARNETTVNEQQNSTVFDVTPTYRHATVNNTTSTPPPTTTLGTPTVNSQSIEIDTAPVITGTYDATNTKVLTVAFNGTTYTLGTSSQLTSPSSGQWSLNVNAQALTSPVTTVTATATDSAGDTKTGTGTITDGDGVIATYLTANNLTATTTADGLRYVITTNGTGAVPISGQTVTVNYSGFLLNSNGTLGTEFDSNTDSQFNHVTPFSFTLGAGTVIAGWEEAFALLPVGTTAQLIIPPSLGYGTTGSGTSIPGNSILVFNVTVLSAS
jgi:FKBP-type peptidyl-prolyl cis-trans isomerase